MLDKNHKKDSMLEYNDSIMQFSSYKNYLDIEHTIPFKKKSSSFDGYTNTTAGSFKLFF